MTPSAKGIREVPLMVIPPLPHGCSKSANDHVLVHHGAGRATGETSKSLILSLLLISLLLLLIPSLSCGPRGCSYLGRWQARQTVLSARTAIQNVLDGTDDRLVVIVGPCSIHDIKAAKDYGFNRCMPVWPFTGLPPASRLAPFISKYSKDLVIIMRVYFEKPRTTVGWKGLINDPDLDGSYKINKGLHIARDLLVSVNELGVPAGTEFLDTISPQYTADTISWGAIGARTTESQLHRELSSGAMQIAVDAIRAASCPHYFMGVTHQGLAGIVGTKGNPYCHIIHRGGSDGPNFSAQHVADTCKTLEKNNLAKKVVL
eukprot:765273-Hanusia_phi.AAC.3